MSPTNPVWSRLKRVHLDAVFSPCRTWRYSLIRVWGDSNNLAAFVGLNPSTADEKTDDPTVRRCRSWAKAWGFGGMIMLNIFAFRATDPRDMRKAEDPVGPGNDKALLENLQRCHLRIAAWGKHGGYLERGEVVLKMMQSVGLVKCFGLNGDGSPKHPLYQPNDVKLKVLKY